MEEMHRTHKEPAWGWFGALLEAVAVLRRSRARRTPRVVKRLAAHPGRC